MRPGDLFFLYTDGVTDAETSGAQFEERLENACQWGHARQCGT